ncbi:MAG: bifunctional oligoribonuclease/PAP phosphatase NrnA [Bacteroidaceae bacterium]|nr:bifunctional oligoribonuclease/PAP phosphatase NrnA [Bacteroidaceae bacterium]
MFNDSIFDAQNIELLRKKISQANNVVICVHVSPDGDAVGSATGLAAYLRQIGKNVTIIFPNQMPDFLKVVPSSHDHLRYDRSPEASDLMIKAADLIFCLDFNSKSRITDMGDKIAEAKAYKIMIDHHLDPDDLCDLVFSYPEMSSTCELVFRILWTMGEYEKLSFDTCKSLYIGMMTDTGELSYNSNRSEVFTTIAMLIEKGIDRDEVHNELFMNGTESRYRMQGHMLKDNLTLYPEFGAALQTLTKEEFKEYGCIKGDTEGNVNIPLSIKGINFSVFLREDTEKENTIRVSLRSLGDIKCNEISAACFNGGGHARASGGELHCSMEEAVEVFNKALIKFEDMLKAR